MNAGRCFGFALLLAALVGCSSSGPISSDLREQEQRITFNQVRADPEGTRGAVVIWGGRIIGVANTTNGGSIYILALPVRDDGKPKAGQPSPGRFIAASPGFVDPEMFPEGMRITVAGPLDGVWTEPLENMDIEYTYPVVEFQQVHLWPESQPRPAPTVTIGPSVYWGPTWGPSPTWWWYAGYPMYRPIYRPGFRGGFHAGVRVGPGPRRGPPGPGRRRR